MACNMCGRAKVAIIKAGSWHAMCRGAKTNSGKGRGLGADDLIIYYIIISVDTGVRWFHHLVSSSLVREEYYCCHSSSFNDS